MSTDKYRYTLHPDRIYVIHIENNIKIEIKGSEIMALMGLESYFED